MKAWTKPKLIVLYKGTSQENVLTYCQNGTPIPYNPLDAQTKNACQFGGEGCADCSTIDLS